MNIIPIIDGFLGLATEVMKHINKPEAEKTVKRIKNLKMDYLEEKQKYPDCDDARMDSLLQEISIEQEAFNNLLIAGSSKSE